MAKNLTPTSAEVKALSTVRPAVIRQAAQGAEPERRAVRAVSLSPREQGLLWSPGRGDAGATSYRVFRDGKPIATVRGTTWFIDKKAQPGAEHTYEVRAVGTLGMQGTPASSGGEAPSAAGQAEAGAAASGDQAAPTQTGAAQAGSEGGQQAVAGALPTPVPQGVKRDGDKFAVVWQPVQGAVQYGIYENGKLIGHTQDPLFGATAPPGVPGVVLEVDAVDAQGKRSAKTQPIPIDMRPGAGQQQQQPGTAQAGQQAPAQQQGQQAAPAQEAQPAAQPAAAQPPPAQPAEQQQPAPQQSAIQRQAAAQQASLAQQQALARRQQAATQVASPQPQADATAPPEG